MTNKDHQTDALEALSVAESGDPSAVAPPVPIPNTEVKRCSPDGSASIGCARVGRRQNLRPASWKQGAGHKFWRRPTLAQAIQALPSGLQRFTSVFGMGTGGATAL